MAAGGDADTRARVRALLAEFDRSIAPQKLALVSVLPDLWTATYGQTSIGSLPAPAPQALPQLGVIKPGAAAAGAAAAAAAAAGIKREGGPLPSQPDAKRPRSAETQRKIDALFKQCQGIVSKRLWSIKSATWFKEPVDPAIAPNYYTFIKRPMDLGTIKTKLQSGTYKTPLEFKEDVDQVWANCAMYNQEGTSVRKAGDSCKAVWERAWREANIEQQWQQIQIEMDPSGVPLYERLSTLTQQLGHAMESVPGPSQPADTSRDMTFAEKRRLSSRLAVVPSGEMAQRVLDIVGDDPVAASGGLSGSDGAEVELDLDQLSSATLWRLQDLLDRPGGGGGARPMVGAAASGAQQQQQPYGRTAPAPAARAAPAAVGGKAPMAVDPNGRANSVHSSGIASESGSGEGGGEGGGQCSQEVKGSTMDGPRHGASGFVRDNRQLVDESATAPKEQSQFVKDRASGRKGDVAINSANWDLLPSDPGPSAEPQPEGDDMWKSFQSIAEQKQQREEQQRQEAEAAERQRREERERAKREEEERQRRLREEEELQAAEMQRQRESQMQKELEEIKARAGTANLTQHSDIASLPGISGLAPSGTGGGLEALGLESRNDDDDMNFDD